MTVKTASLILVAIGALALLGCNGGDETVEKPKGPEVKGVMSDPGAKDPQTRAAEAAAKQQQQQGGDSGQDGNGGQGSK